MSLSIGGSLSTLAAASAVAILLGKNFASLRVFLVGGGIAVDDERIVGASGERLRGRLGMRVVGETCTGETVRRGELRTGR